MIKMLIGIFWGCIFLACLGAVVHKIFEIGKKEGIVKENYKNTEDEENV